MVSPSGARLALVLSTLASDALHVFATGWGRGLFVAGSLAMAWFGSAAGCGGPDPKEFAREQAKAGDQKRPRGEVVTFRPAVAAGKHIPCEVLFPAEVVADSFGAAASVREKWSELSPLSAECLVMPDSDGAAAGAKDRADENSSSADSKRGVLSQSLELQKAICRVALRCDIPTDAERLLASCADTYDGKRVDVGVPGCLRRQSSQTPGASLLESQGVERIKYWVNAIDPDTACEVISYAMSREQSAVDCARAAVRVTDRAAAASAR